MADATYVKFYGLHNLSGRNVTVFACGLDCGDYTVTSTGTVLVPFGSDPDGLFTIVRIVAIHNEAVALGSDWGPLATKIDVYTDALGTVTYTVPVAVGFTYTSQGQVLRPVTEAETKSPRGTGLGKKRRVHQFGVLVDNTVGVSFGTDFDNLRPAQFRDDDGSLLDNATTYSGVWWDTVDDDSSFDGMLCWETSRPYPTTIVSLTGFMETEEN